MFFERLWNINLLFKCQIVEIFLFKRQVMLLFKFKIQLGQWLPLGNFFEIEQIRIFIFLYRCVIKSLCSPNVEFQKVNPTTQIALFSFCINECPEEKKLIWNISLLFKCQIVEIFLFKRQVMLLFKFKIQLGQWLPLGNFLKSKKSNVYMFV